ncbi:hypothetical protein ES705_35488 [subsurface metagenome]
MINLFKQLYNRYALFKKTTLPTCYKMNDKNRIEQILKGKGFTDYKWINPKEIIVSQWVRVKCEFGCSDYGLRACPPNTPTVQECKDFFQRIQ